MDKETIFKECGLTNGESKTYSALLELRFVSVGPIIKKSNLQRSVVYYCLESLMKKGLVSYVVKNNVNHYQAENPEKLFKLLEKRKDKIENAKESLEKSIKYIEYEKSKLVINPGKVFTGWDGLKTAFQDILKSLKKGEEYYVFGINQKPVPYEKFQRFLTKFHQKRVDKGIKIKHLLSRELDKSIGKVRAKEPLTQVKYVPAEIGNPTVINVYKNKVLMTMWVENPFALLIENKEIADSFKNYFLILWNKA